MQSKIWCVYMTDVDVGAKTQCVLYNVQMVWLCMYCTVLCN